MGNPIQILRSTVASNAPVLGVGATDSNIGWNAQDELLWLLDAAGDEKSYDLGNLGGVLNLITTATASNSTSVDFTSGIDGTYKYYLFDLTDVRPATDGAFLSLRTSTDGGSTYDSGANDYTSLRFEQRSHTPNTVNPFGFENADSMFISGGLGTDANSGYNGRLQLANPAGTGYTSLVGHAMFQQSASVSGRYTQVMLSGNRQSAADVDAISFLMSTGNISSGSFKMYGVL